MLNRNIKKYYYYDLWVGLTSIYLRKKGQVNCRSTYCVHVELQNASVATEVG